MVIRQGVDGAAVGAYPAPVVVEREEVVMKEICCIPLRLDASPS
jgi:hypothetical protein